MSGSTATRLNPVNQEDRRFRHYSLKHRVIAWISTRLFDNVVYTVRHGPLAGFRRKGGLGWIPRVFAPSRPAPEQEFLQALDFKGKTVYDVGAFHGLMTLFFASRARQVVSFEPNSRNYRRFHENLALNRIQNVIVRKAGVGSRRQTAQMAGNPLMPGGSSVDESIVAGLRRGGQATVSEEIAIVTLDEEIDETGLPPPDFIKIDIEGWELEALRGAQRTLARFKPALFLEMHGETMAEKMRKAQEIVTFLWDCGYRSVRHIESGTGITPANAGVAAQGHLYCEYRT
jgi:FkbM family methyltransferase